MTAIVTAKQELLAATERQLTALSKELSEKYKYLQDQDQATGPTPSKGSASTAAIRQGLFEKIASLGKATELTLLQQPKEEGKREREAEEEVEEPPRKRTRTEGREKMGKTKKSSAEEKTGSKVWAVTHSCLD